MAESENDVDQGPPGVQTQVRADQYDMRDDYDDDDQEQRDTGYLRPPSPSLPDRKSVV